MWIYNQANGVLSRDGKLVGYGYSGLGAGKNDPAAERIRDVGPIPRGKYRIGPRFDSEAHGTLCMRLTPETETETFGRSGFLIHGDSSDHPGAASHGCIVIGRPVRIQISQSGDEELEVV